jgi:hypothetical protein
VEIGEKGVADALLRGEGPVGVERVHRDAQDLDVVGASGREHLGALLVLDRADGGKVEGVEEQNDVLLASVVGERDLLADRRRKREIRGGVSGLERHGNSSSELVYASRRTRDSIAEAPVEVGRPQAAVLRNRATARPMMRTV